MGLANGPPHRHAADYESTLPDGRTRQTCLCGAARYQAGSVSTRTAWVEWADRDPEDERREPTTTELPP